MSDQLFSVENKICIVTGGLGRSARISSRSSGSGAPGWPCGAAPSTTSAIAKTLGEEALKTSALRFYSVDITKKEEMNAALDDMEEVWGDAPDVLVNNAGIDTQPSAPPEVSGPFENFPEEIFREVVDVNLVGTFLACQAVGARMVKAGKGGSIINVGSIYGMLSPIQDIYAYKKEMTGVPFIKPVAYSAAKSGIYNLTRYLATYWGKQGIRVNTLTPAGVWRDTQDEIFQANFCAGCPWAACLRRMSTTAP